MSSTARIAQLPPAVVAKIAAGEVIERPASVVKELFENSIDGGATRIDVEIAQGGTDLIRIVDDGHGIAPEDLPLAFASHATSKLVHADDLGRIDTLGFRGEALWSIGGVAQVALQSRPRGQAVGAQVSCHGGVLAPVQAWNGTPGTRVEVRHLFFNTPARRKFLKSLPTEAGHVSETVTRQSLARPTLHVTLRHNGKSVFDVPSTATLLDRIALFFGSDLRGHLLPVEATQGSARLHGFIGHPACERGNAKMQYLFVKGRCVRDRSLSHAFQEAYRGLLMTGRYAVIFLFLELPADEVDVNVHPTKAEVRFRDAGPLHHLVYSALRHKLQSEKLTTPLRVPSTLANPQVQGGPLPGAPRFELSPPPVADSPRLPFAAPTPTASTPAPTSGMVNVAFEAPASEEEFSDTGMSPETPRAIQLYDAYLVIETLEGMLVIDQHALHERILFEELKERFRQGPLETQRLLIPEPLEVGASQKSAILEHQSALAELGLGVEDFGAGTLLLVGYPTLLDRRSPSAILKRVVDYLVAHDRPPSREHLLNDLLSLMACHAAVRAGDRLSPEEIAVLIEQRELAADTHHCPHGRPTALLFSRQELERQFGRI